MPARVLSELEKSLAVVFQNSEPDRRQDIDLPQIDMENKTKTSKSVVFVLGAITSGGAERVASNIMHYWHNKGWQLTLITGHGPEEDFYTLPENMERVIINQGSPSRNKIVGLTKNIPYVLQLRKKLKKNDSTYVISFLTRTNIHTILASVGLKKHVIISERNDTTREKHLWPWPLLRKLLYRYADVVTANSEIALQGMKEYVKNEKLKIVPNPVIIPSRQASPQKSKKILNIGRLVPQKAQDLLLESLSLINEKNLNDWSLDILGEGEEEKKLRMLSEKWGLDNVVKFRGLIDNPNSFYCNAGIFILSSRYEGTPNVLLEAMSFGLPCIISDSLPGAVKLIENNKNGLIFRSGDAVDLADKMTFLMSNPEKRQQFGIAARERVKEFSLDNVMPIWENILNDDQPE